jgi:hypothetical protein
VADGTRRKDVAQPAPFTPEQVAALIAGKANQTRIAKVLAAHRQPRIPAPKMKGQKYASKGPAPIPLTAAQLRELAANSGTTPDAIATLLESTIPKRRGSSGKARKSAARPNQRPPL